MSARSQRWAWTAAMSLLPFIVVAFGRMDIDVTQWTIEARMLTGMLSAVLGVAAATFPYREYRS